jgi:integrase
VACITAPDGKQRQFSTGLEDQAEALAVAVAAERSLRKTAANPHQLRAALDRLADDYVPASDEDPAAWMLTWAQGRTGTVAKRSLQAYQTTAKESAAFFREKSIRSFSALTPQRVQELRDWWAGQNGPVTTNTKMKHLRIALKQAVLARRMDRNPAAEVPRLREADTVRREFRPAEIDLLLPTLTGEWRAIFLLGLYTGQRLNDLAEIQWRNVDLVAKTIAFQARKTRTLVALPLVAACCEALTALPSADNPDAAVFPQVAALKATSRSNAFRELLAAVGLALPVVREKQEGILRRRKTSELSFHSLRHTATSMLKAAGVSDAIARAIVGHESAAVSRAYTHLDMETMRKALEKMAGT